MPVFVLIGLLFIYNQDMWSDLMYTLTLVILSSLISVMIGVPLGILMAKSNKVEIVIKPILDIMQTMPGFVYLIPAVAFFLALVWFLVCLLQLFLLYHQL